MIIKACQKAREGSEEHHIEQYLNLAEAGLLDIMCVVLLDQVGFRHVLEMLSRSLKHFMRDDIDVQNIPICSNLQDYIEIHGAYTCIQQKINE